MPWLKINHMIRRNLTAPLLDALSDTPVVLLNGARQVGKSTLVQSLADDYPAQYLTLDDVTVLTAASGDPAGFLAGLDGPVILDEVQNTGLLTAALGLSRDRLEEEPQLAGPLLESFVLMEVRKQATWSETRPELFHYRTQTGQEVDLLLEDARGRVVGIEVKAGATVQERDVRTLLELAEALGKRFVRGVVLYTGERAVPFSEKVMALPMAALWHR